MKEIFKFIMAYSQHLLSSIMVNKPISTEEIKSQGYGLRLQSFQLGEPYNAMHRQCPYILHQPEICSENKTYN